MEANLNLARRARLVGLLVIGIAIACGASHTWAWAGRTIRGTVIDADGRPVANIAVKLVIGPGKPGGPGVRPPGANPVGDVVAGIPTASQLQKGPGDLGPNDKIVSQTKTDASGNFTFTNVQAGRYAIVAGSGKVAVRMTIVIAPEVDPPPQQLKLPKSK